MTSFHYSITVAYCLKLQIQTHQLLPSRLNHPARYGPPSTSIPHPQRQALIVQSYVRYRAILGGKRTGCFETLTVIFFWRVRKPELILEDE